jgi:diketogulonate reductase-like aldo/keto reductase
MPARPRHRLRLPGHCSTRPRPAPITGARTVAQLEDNLGALDVAFTEDELARLQTASAVELGFPHEFLQRPMPRSVMFGGANIRARG